MDYPYIPVSFLFPVINGRLYVSQRGTPPHQGYWGAIGGKNTNTSHPYNQLHCIEKLGGTKVLCIADSINKKLGLEFCIGAAIREFCEEVFSDKSFPEDFNEKDFTNMHRIGSAIDTFGGREFDCNFVIAQVNRNDFYLSPRELTAFAPLDSKFLGLKDRIWPLSKLALAHLKSMLCEFKDFYPGYPRCLHEQIPDFNIPKEMVAQHKSSLIGVLF